MTPYRYVLLGDRAALPVWCMFNMSPAQRDRLNTELHPLAILGGCVCVCVAPSPHFSWQKGMPWRFFPPPPACLSKNKEMADREHENLFYPFSLGNYTDKAWKIEVLSFFHWNAGINGVKMEKRDCEKWLIVAISSAFDLASSLSDCWTVGKTCTESFGV